MFCICTLLLRRYTEHRYMYSAIFANTSQEFLYKDTPPELKMSPTMYFVIFILNTVKRISQPHFFFPSSLVRPVIIWIIGAEIQAPFLWSVLTVIENIENCLMWIITKVINSILNRKLFWEFWTRPYLVTFSYDGANCTRTHSDQTVTYLAELELTFKLGSF